MISIADNRRCPPAGSDYEYELKYVFPGHLFGLLLPRVRSRCRLDPQYPVGTVTSIYFDTRGLRYLNEKLNSDYIKRKVRLRWYSDPGDGGISRYSYLELKDRIGSKRTKFRLPVEYSGEKLAEMDLSRNLPRDLSAALRSAGVSLPGGLFPVCRIAYSRRRFIEPVTKSRVCLDYDISVTGWNKRMLAGRCPLELPQGVMEIKGTERRLPGVLREHGGIRIPRRSFSKYAVCCLGGRPA